MKIMKRLFPVLMCLVLVVAAVAAMTVASTADNANHASISVDKENVYVGDTITVTFKAGQNKNVTTLTGGIRFDSEYLKCTGVTLAETSGNALLTEVALNPDSQNEDFRMVVLSTVAEANAVNQVGFSSVGTTAVDYSAADLFVATFEVLKAGTFDVIAYESSYVGINNDEVQRITITAEERAADVAVVAKTGKVNINYTVSGQVVTVTHDIACKVGYWDEATSKYVAIAAVKVSENTYSFTAPAGVTEVLLVVNGDVNNDGSITTADKTRITAAILKRTTLSDISAFAADANGKDGVTTADKTRINAVILKRTTMAW